MKQNKAKAVLLCVLIFSTVKMYIIFTPIINKGHFSLHTMPIIFLTTGTIPAVYNNTLDSDLWLLHLISQKKLKLVKGGKNTQTRATLENNC